MNKYFTTEESIYELTEKYPEALEILISVGFTNLSDEKMRKTMGKNIKVSQALKMKNYSVKTFEEKLLEKIEEKSEKVDLSLMNEDNKSKGDIKILGVLPCPVRIPLLEGFDKWLGAQEESYRERLDYTLQAASMGLSWMKDSVKEATNPDVLADLFISAGFDLFFDKNLMGKFKEQGVFLDMSGYEKYNLDFENDELNLRDPLGQYSMLSVVSAIFLVNMEELGDREVPKSWEDILKPEFSNSVSLPIADFDLFNAILLNINKKYGAEGIKKLGKSLLRSMHPSEMVKSHTKKNNRPAITIMPYFFTKMIKEEGPMKAVWPEDGAIISPIFMLTKKESKEKVKPLVDFFTSKEVGEILSHQGLFLSVNPEVENNISKDKKFMWLGWDYINENDIGKVLEELFEIFNSSALSNQVE